MGDEQEMSSRGYLALGIGYSLNACEGIVLRALLSLVVVKAKPEQLPLPITADRNNATNQSEC